MHKKNLLISGSILAVLILALGLTSLLPTAPLAQAQAGATAMTATPVDVQVGTDPKLGPILKNGKGLTLYLFQADKPGVSNCSGPCAAAWPPYTLKGGMQPTGSPEVTGKLGTLTRSDGSVQVTINNLPLYTFIKDQDSGDAYGQGINAFGGLWWTVKPDGSPNPGAGGPMPTPGAAVK